MLLHVEDLPLASRSVPINRFTVCNLAFSKLFGSTGVLFTDLDRDQTKLEAVEALLYATTVVASLPWLNASQVEMPLSCPF